MSLLRNMYKWIRRFEGCIWHKVVEMLLWTLTISYRSSTYSKCQYSKMIDITLIDRSPAKDRLALVGGVLTVKWD